MSLLFTFTKEPGDLEIKTRGIDYDAQGFLQSGEILDPYDYSITVWDVTKEIDKLGIGEVDTVEVRLTKAGEEINSQTYSVQDDMDTLIILMIDSNNTDNEVTDSIVVPGSMTITDAELKARFQGGVDGHDYLIRFVVNTSSGRKETEYAKMQVRGTEG